MTDREEKETQDLLSILHNLRHWFKKNHMDTPFSIELRSERDVIDLGILLKRGLPDLYLTEARGNPDRPEKPEYVVKLLDMEIRGPAISRVDMQGRARIPTTVTFVEQLFPEDTAE